MVGEMLTLSYDARELQTLINSFDKYSQLVEIKNGITLLY